MGKSKIQKTLTESQIKEIKKIMVETAELIVDKKLKALSENKSKVLKKRINEAVQKLKGED
jgi:ATP phosphoribosyltransferase